MLQKAKIVNSNNSTTMTQFAHSTKNVMKCYKQTPEMNTEDLRLTLTVSDTERRLCLHSPNKTTTAKPLTIKT